MPVQDYPATLPSEERLRAENELLNLEVQHLRSRLAESCIVVDEQNSRLSGRRLSSHRLLYPSLCPRWGPSGQAIEA